jgi:hypothetical protein
MERGHAGPQKVAERREVFASQEDLLTPPTHQSRQSGRRRPHDVNIRISMSLPSQFLAQPLGVLPHITEPRPLKPHEAGAGERRVAQPASNMAFALQELVHIIEMLQDIVIRLEGLHKHPAGLFSPTRTPSQLNQQRIGALRRAKVWQPKPVVC